MEEKSKYKLATGVFLRTSRKPSSGFDLEDKPGDSVLPAFDPQDFPRALRIERAARLVGRSLESDD